MVIFIHGNTFSGVRLVHERQRGLETLYGRLGREKRLSSISKIKSRFHGSEFRVLVTILTEIFRLLAILFGLKQLYPVAQENCTTRNSAIYDLHFKISNELTLNDSRWWDLLRRKGG